MAQVVKGAPTPDGLIAVTVVYDAAGGERYIGNKESKIKALLALPGHTHEQRLYDVEQRRLVAKEEKK